VFFSKKVFRYREINRVRFQNEECEEKGIRFLMAQWAIKNLIQIGEKRFVILIVGNGCFILACLHTAARLHRVEITPKGQNYEN